MYSEYLLHATFWNHEYEQVIAVSRTLEKLVDNRHSCNGQKESYSGKQSKEAAAKVCQGISSQGDQGTAIA